MPPQEPVDWDRERERANSQTQASLIRLARDAGYDVDEGAGKGSHVKVTRPGLPRPVIIPNKIYRINAQQIIDALRRGAE
jgi:hypothetical protein